MPDKFMLQILYNWYLHMPMYATTSGFYVLIYYLATSLMTLERIDVSLPAVTAVLTCSVLHRWLNLKCKTHIR